MLNDKIETKNQLYKRIENKKNSIYENEDQIWNKKINEITS